MTRRRSKVGTRRLPPLPPAIVEFLGAVSDRDLAARAGVSPRTIRAHREARRIAPASAGRKPVTGTTRDQRHYYVVTPAESLAIHLAVEAAQRSHSDVARELMLAWAREHALTPTNEGSP